MSSNDTQAYQNGTDTQLDKNFPGQQVEVASLSLLIICFVAFTCILFMLCVFRKEDDRIIRPTSALSKSNPPRKISSIQRKIKVMKWSDVAASPTTTTPSIHSPTSNNNNKSQCRPPQLERKLESRMTSSSFYQDQECCAICLSSFRPSDEVCQSKNSSSCTHTFHLACMGEWLLLHDICPICREYFLDEKEVRKDDNV